MQNVVTYGVIIEVENPQLKLKPGMTANLTMVVDEHDDVLTVPNAALRFTPAGYDAGEDCRNAERLLLPLGSSGAAPAQAFGRGASQQLRRLLRRHGSAGRRASRGGRAAEAGVAVAAEEEMAGEWQRKRRQAAEVMAAAVSGSRWWWQPDARTGGNGGQRRWWPEAEVAARAAAAHDFVGRGICPAMFKPIPVRTGLNDGTRTEVIGAEPDGRNGDRGQRSQPDHHSAGGSPGDQLSVRCPMSVAGNRGRGF